MTAFDQLAALILPERHQLYKQKIDFELNLFRTRQDLVDYYLHVHKSGQKVTNNPNSWVAWAVGITDDLPTGPMPIKDPTPPDIDTDWGNRDVIIDRFFQLYGDDHTAMIGTTGTMKSKLAIKDIVRTDLGGTLPEYVIDPETGRKKKHPIHELCASIKAPPAGLYPTEKTWLDGYTDDDGHFWPGHRQDNKELDAWLKQHPRYEELLYKMLGLPRSWGVHAGGVVVTPGPIDRCLPTRYDGDRKITQINHKMVEKIGGIKYDILGVNTLNFIWGCKRLVKKRYGIDLDPYNLPEEVSALKTLWSGYTDSVFQFDSDIAKKFLTAIHPTSVEDLCLITAVGRPGCLDSKLEDGVSVADHFIARRTGKEAVSYLHPCLESILKPTFGIPVFQEQIQRIFEVVAGFTPQESDNARRAIGKKKLDVLLSLKGKFKSGAKSLHGIDEKLAEEIWGSFEGAANYSFNRSHSAAYAVIAYACVYLRTKYPLEWWTAVLSNSTQDEVRAFLPVVRDFLAPPHINHSKAEFIIDEQKKLITPFTQIAKVGPSAVAAIVANQPYASFKDFHERANVKKDVAINLILADCFRNLPTTGPDSQAYSVPDLLEYYFSLRREGKRGKAAEAEVVPEEYRDLDRFKLANLRASIMATATMDCIDEFKDLILAAPGMEADPHFGLIWRRMVKVKTGPWRSQWEEQSAVTPLIRDYNKLTKLSENVQVFIVGTIAERTWFEYTDRRRNHKVKGLKIKVSNDGKVQSVTLWPSYLETADAEQFKEGKLVAFAGVVKQSDKYGPSFNVEEHRVLS